MSKYTEESRPNILVLMSDQHSKRQLGCYGDSLVRTPNLDRLASEGMLFENAYCPSPVCVPSRMSFMTGRTPSGNRVWTNQNVLHSGIPTWSHALGIAGYETALIGRMHFVGPDQRHGFERRPLGEYMAVHPGAPMQGEPIFQAIPTDTTSQHRVSVEMAGVGLTSYNAFDDMVTNALVEYLEEKSSRDGRPFAAVAGFMMPHCPFFAPEELFDYYLDKVDVPMPTLAELERQPQAVKDMKKLRHIDEPLTEHQIRVARAAYYGMCELFDASVGRVLEKLDETGLAEDTLVVYTTDHGEAAGEHGMWWKSSYYEESVGVPLIARLPGVIPSGSRNPLICNTFDLAPTFVEASGAGELPQIAGRSLWTEMKGRTDETRPNETFSELHGMTGVPGLGTDPPSRMVRQGPWKLYYYRGHDTPVLYNLDDDPGELHDLGSDPAYADVRECLFARLLDGWDPDDVYQQSTGMLREMDIIKEWGATVQPVHEDTLPVPPDSEHIELR